MIERRVLITNLWYITINASARALPSRAATWRTS